MEIRTITPEEYEAFGNDKTNWTFMNSLEQGRKMAGNGWSVEYLGGFEDGKLKAAALHGSMPVAKLYHYSYLPAGILFEEESPEAIEAFSKGLLTYLKGRNTLYVQTDPHTIWRERDADGQIVEGGKDNTELAEAFEKAGWNWEKPQPGYQDDRVYYVSVLDTKGKDIDTLMKEMDQQTRWSINRARKYDLVIRTPRDEKDLEAFEKMMAHTGERNGFEINDAAYYRRTLESFGNRGELLLAFMDTEKFRESQQVLYDEAKARLEAAEEKLKENPNSKKFVKKKKVELEAMELAEKKMQEADELKEKYGSEILLAGSLFCNTDRETCYLYSGAYDEFLKYNAPYAIHYEELKRTLDAGRDTYNFYGISGNFEKDEPGYPLFAFKRGFGCGIQEYLGLFTLPVKGLEFSLYNKMKHVI